VRNRAQNTVDVRWRGVHEARPPVEETLRGAGGGPCLRLIHGIGTGSSSGGCAKWLTPWPWVRAGPATLKRAMVRPACSVDLGA